MLLDLRKLMFFVARVIIDHSGISSFFFNILSLHRDQSFPFLIMISHVSFIQFQLIFTHTATLAYRFFSIWIHHYFISRALISTFASSLKSKCLF